MTITRAISNAARRVNSRKRMIALYWFTQVVLAALAALPLLGIAVPVLAHSGYASELLKQFDVMFLVEAVRLNTGVAKVLFPIYPFIILITMTAGVFLAGGAVKLMVREAIVYSPGEFWSGCGEYFWRFFRLMLYSLFFYGLASALAGGVGKAAGRIWGEGIEEAPIVMAGWAADTLLIFLCGIVSTAMDYAKVRLVSDESRKSLRACVASLWLVLRNPRVLGAWLVLAVFWILFTLVYQPVANSIAATTMPVIVLLAIWQQLYILARVWLRFLSWGTAVEFDPAVRPPRLPPEEFVPMVVPEVAEDFAI
jgi:hypothetical protein